MVIADFDQDADHLLSKDEIPENMMIASRMEVPEYEGASHKVRDHFGSFDTDENDEVDSLEWSNQQIYFRAFLSEVGTAAMNPKLNGKLTPETLCWMNSTNVPEVPSPLLIDGLIYTVKDGGKVWFHIITPSGIDLGFYEDGHYANGTLEEGYCQAFEEGKTIFNSSEYGWGEGYYQMFVSSLNTPHSEIEVQYWIE